MSFSGLEIWTKFACTTVPFLPPKSAISTTAASRLFILRWMKARARSYLTQAGMATMPPPQELHTLPANSALLCILTVLQIRQIFRILTHIRNQAPLPAAETLLGLIRCALGGAIELCW